MADLLEVSFSSVELADLSCPVCQGSFDIGQEVVQCPVCDCWHHLACWRYNNHSCSTLNCSGSGHLQSRPVASNFGESDVQLDDITFEQNPVFIEVLPASDLSLLGDIVILEDGQVFDDYTVNIQVSPSNNIGNSEEINIEIWELELDKFLEKSRLSSLLNKTGIQKTIAHHVKGKDYYVAIGALVAWTMVLLIICVIVITLIAVTLFG